MLTIANLLVVTAAVVGVQLILGRFLPSYVGEKGKNLATREDISGITRAVEAVKQQFASDLEHLRQGQAISRERFARDYGLFASKRNEVYAELYSLFEKARGAMARNFGLRLSPNFDSFHADDIRQYLADGDLLQSSQEAVKELLAAGDLSSARIAVAKLEPLISCQRAARATAEYKNAYVLNQLYLGSEVERVSSMIWEDFGKLEISMIVANQPGQSSKSDDFAITQHLRALGDELRRAMRDEMRAAITELQPVAPDRALRADG